MVTMQKKRIACQRYYYEDNHSAIEPGGGRAADVTERNGLVAASRELRLFENSM